MLVLYKLYFPIPAIKTFLFYSINLKTEHWRPESWKTETTQRQNQMWYFIHITIELTVTNVTFGYAGRQRRHHTLRKLATLVVTRIFRAKSDATSHVPRQKEIRGLMSGGRQMMVWPRARPSTGDVVTGASHCHVVPNVLYYFTNFAHFRYDCRVINNSVALVGQ